MRIDSKKSKNKVLRFADPSVNNASILTKMFQQMLFSMGIINHKQVNGEIVKEGSQKWDHLMELFLADSRNSIPQNEKDRHSARGNLQKEIVTNANMSWKVFCKALRLINVVKFDFVIVAKFDGEPDEYVFKESVVLGKRIPYPPKYIPPGSSQNPQGGGISLKKLLQESGQTPITKKDSDDKPK